jgi:hypothetical protein
LRTFATSQYGLTVGQSLGRALVVATTLKLVRAGRVFGVASETGDAALDAAAELDVDAETSTGLDAGALLNLGVARVGVTVRNLRQPEFGEGETTFELDRQVRGGFALTAGRFGIFDSAVAAVDWDFTKTDTAVGEAQQLAFGGELWTAASRIGLRAGMSRNTVGLEDDSVSVGMSLGPARGFFLDGVWTFGSAEARRGWGVSTRVTF